jgi:3-oxoacyl-[acyl-carrier protein] reductase
MALKGKVALVTGGSAGIGKAIALKLAEEGADVVIFGTNLERGNQVVSDIQKNYSVKAHFFAVDVSKTLAVEEALKEVLHLFSKVDILVNNAGITKDQLLMKMTEEEWDQVLEVNVKSCFNTSKALTRPMMKARSGVIINMTSVIGLTGNPGQVNYAASKAAMIGFTKALARELASRNIRVNAIAPGFIDTSMTHVLTEEQKKAILEKVPLGRLGTAEDIANMVAFLADDKASYITGQVFVVDGGMVM